MIKIKIKVASDNQNLLPGGAGDNTDPESLDQEELYIGSEEEMEHTSDPAKAFEISTDHLTDNPHYYSQLKKSGLGDDKPLPAKKSDALSKYWKKRAKRRALKAGRSARSNKDKNWALDQQKKSKDINKKIKDMFIKELQVTEELSSTIEEFLKRLKEKQVVKTFDGKKPKKPSKTKQGNKKKYPITHKIRATPNSVAVGAGFGGPAGE